MIWLESFTNSVETFLETATYLDDSDAPMITALKQAAAELDSNGVQAALLNTFGVTYRTLLRKAGQTGTTKSDKQKFLEGLE